LILLIVVGSGECRGENSGKLGHDGKVEPANPTAAFVGLTETGKNR
jgi:hypothetical protein